MSPLKWGETVRTEAVAHNAGPVASGDEVLWDWPRGRLQVQVLDDIVAVPGSLPLPALPDLALVPALILPAVSLAFVGLIQGAAISAGMPNPDCRYPDADRDLIGQGVGNLVSGLFRGMPVGGSMSATMIGRSAGSTSRAARWTSGPLGCSIPAR